MAEQRQGTERLLPEQRAQIIERLCEHFAQDHLTLEELERRLDVAERTQDRNELAALLADLQPHLPMRTAPEPVPAPATEPPLPAERPANGAIVAIMSGAERLGHWRPAAHNLVLCIMGGAELDFRDVRLPPGETEVFVLALMGGADIIVPPGLAVDVSGFAIMGGFSHVTPPTRPHPDAPLLKITGFALMGGVDIDERLPGESARDAKRRRRERGRRR
jgi:hypothetical protein